MARPVSNPPNPWSSTWVDFLDEPPAARLSVYEEDAKSILARNESPDIPFRWSVNPYRGCQHACAYCYARPTHQHLSFGAGTDFDKKIVVKRNAPELLRQAFARRSWKGETVNFSGITDPYQPLEASYGLTRGLLEVAAEFRNPVTVVTKAALVRRDIDVLVEIERKAGAMVFVSIPFADARTARAIEPGAPSPARRFETLRALSAAGIPTGVAVAPIIPGLNDNELATILTRAHEAGARSAFPVLLRLADEVEVVFRERLEAAFPDRAKRVFHALREMRQGRVATSGFGRRMSGAGPRWEALERLFTIQCRRLGLATGELSVLRPRPAPGPSVRQPGLFDT